MLPLPSPPLLGLPQVAHPLRRLLDRPHRQLERDRSEALRLPGAHDAEADQLEERQEDDDHLGAVGVGAEQARELASRADHEPGQDARHALADRETLALDVVRARRTDALEDVAQRTGASWSAPGTIGSLGPANTSRESTFRSPSATATSRKR